MKVQFYTYVWRDYDGVPIYVGKGQGKRAWNHETQNTRLGYTIRKRLRQGYVLEPEITIRQSEAWAFRWEIRLIKKYGREDLNLGTLFNQTDGGEGVSGPKTKRRIQMSLETRKKISEAHKGKASPKKGIKLGIMSEEVKIKRRLKMEEKGTRSGNRKGFQHSEESKRKISESHKGKISPFKGVKNGPLTLEQKQERAKKRKPSNYVMSEETRQKIIQANKGVPKTEEHKRKLSESALKRVKDPNIGKKISEAKKRLKLERSLI